MERCPVKMFGLEFHQECQSCTPGDWDPYENRCFRLKKKFWIRKHRGRKVKQVLPNPMGAKDVDYEVYERIEVFVDDYKVIPWGYRTKIRCAGKAEKIGEVTIKVG